jgi:hypothetical protein
MDNLTDFVWNGGSSAPNGSAPAVNDIATTMNDTVSNGMADCRTDEELHEYEKVEKTIGSFSASLTSSKIS